MLCIFCHFRPLKALTIRMDHAKLLDVLMSLPVSHAILPRAVCFATSRPVNYAICSYMDLSGYASGPIRKCLFIDFIIMELMTCLNALSQYFKIHIQLSKEDLKAIVKFEPPYSMHVKRKGSGETACFHRLLLAN